MLPTGLGKFKSNFSPTLDLTIPIITCWPIQEHVVLVRRHGAERGAPDVHQGSDEADAALAALPRGARGGRQEQGSADAVAP